MAYDYEKAKAAYESLTPEQQQQYVNNNKDNATVQQFARDYAREKSQASTTTTTPNYQNQGAGNYVYNEKTGYYENQTDTSRNTTNQGLAPRPENVKTETPTKQGETTVNTVPEIQQQGQLKPLSQDYYNQTSDEAQNKIRANLNGYRQTNPELFSTYEDFKKNFSYDSRDEVQKQTLDNWYTGYQKSMELSAVPTNELYTQYKDGTVSLSDLETLRISNPTKYAELQETINKGNIISAYDDDKGADTGMNIQDMAYQFLAQSFNKLMNGDSSNGASQIFKEYQDKMDNPEMLELSDNCTEVQEQMENIQSDIDSMKKQVEAEYEGTGASRAKINAIIADRTYDLQLQLRTLNSEYNKYATQYNNRMQQYQNEFNMQLQEYQINQNERQVQMKELGFALDLMNFETNDQKQEREWNYWVRQQEYQNGNINSKDYQTRYKAALNSVNNLLSQYEGIPMVRSAEEMAQDILTAIDNGSNLGAELSKINQQIQKKPEYKYLYNNTYGKGNDISYQTFKLGDQEYIVYNNELLSSDEFNKKYGGKATGATGEAKPYDIVDAKVFSQAPVDYGYETLGTFLANPNNAKDKNGGWCGAFVNRYLKSIGVTNENYYDDNLSTKLNSVNTKVPKEGSIAVFDFGHITAETGQNHGHVGIVTKVYSDGSFDVIESNFNSDKKIGTRQHINPQSSSVKGFFDPSQPPAGSQSQSSSNTATSADRLTLTALRNGQIVNSKVPETIDQLVKAGFSEDEINEALNQNMEYYLPDDQRAEKNAILNSFRSNDIVKNFQSSTEQLLGLSAAVEQQNGAGDLASIYMFMRAQDPRSVVRENEFEAAASTMGLGAEVQTWFTKLANGQRLTPEQRQNFIDVTVKVLEAKKQAYKLVYDDAVSQMKAASIPSVYYPTDRATEIDGIISRLKGNTSSTTTTTQYSSVYTPKWQYKYTQDNNYDTGNYVSIDGYEFDLSGF